ncbi:MAG: hypothetical protein WBB15_09515 [Ornithinimicrobium sp.]
MTQPPEDAVAAYWKVKPNDKYGGVNSSSDAPEFENGAQKYNPFGPITARDGPGPDGVVALQALFAVRTSSILKWNGKLNLRTDFGAIVREENAKAKGKGQALPPIIVVSSNRSVWIDECLSAAKPETTENAETYKSPWDLSAHADDNASPPVFPPLYAPARTAGRSVFILVRNDEYSRYKVSLERFESIRVVGWAFDQSSEPPDNEGRWRPWEHNAIAGFGASRFAAVQFCREMRRRGVGWSKAWLMDDNVVRLAIASFAEEEGKLDGGLHAAGFQGAKQVTSIEYLKETAGTPKPSTIAVKKLSGVLLQQVVLLNLTKLESSGNAFSPAFVAAAEDKSFTSLLRRETGTLRFIKSTAKGDPAVVTKAEAVPESNGTVNGDRNSWEKKLARLESKVRVFSKGRSVTVETFIKEELLANRPPDAPKVDEFRARCQAVEQLMSRSTSAKRSDAKGSKAAFLLDANFLSGVYGYSHLDVIGHQDPPPRGVTP